MSREKILGALSRVCEDRALQNQFLEAWPPIRDLLQAFCVANRFPMFLYLNEVQILQSSPETMPFFCQVMLSNPETRHLCAVDGNRRATGAEPEVSPGIQMCHAGMLNRKRSIDTGPAGQMVLVFGARRSTSAEAESRRNLVIERQKSSFQRELRQADRRYRKQGPISDPDLRLMDTIAAMVQSFLRATFTFHYLSINMAHELANSMLGTGLMMQEIDDILSHGGKRDFLSELRMLADHQSHVLAECRLALYVIRNFLSHSSEYRYNEVVSPSFSKTAITPILRDMISLYSRIAARKGIKIIAEKLEEVPAIRGSDIEIRRAFHNVLNNAVKYSYRSSVSQRTIDILIQKPYDPGFRKLRFAVIVKNFGLGVTAMEERSVFRPGFRGNQALREVPIGSGIGLSEVAKIMRLHGGEAKFKSREVHKDEHDEPTFLTTVSLIFPYTEADDRHGQ